MLKIKPLNDFVFLLWEKKKESKSGIVLADVSKSRPSKAKVIAVGPGEIDKSGKFRKVNLKVGDIIILDPFIPQSIKVDGEEYLVCRERDIFAKIS